MIRSLILQGACCCLGLGQAITPYQKPPSVAEVKAMRAISDKSRLILDYEQKGTQPITIFDVGVGYCIGGADNVPKFTFDGQDLQGNAISIRLGDIESIVMGQVSKNSVVIEIAAISGVTEEELLMGHLTYSALKDRGKRVTVSIPRQRSSASLCLSGRKRLSSESRDAFIALELQPKGSIIYFAYDGSRIWWAVPTVAADPSNPFRVGVTPLEGWLRPKISSN